MISRSRDKLRLYLQVVGVSSCLRIVAYCAARHEVSARQAQLHAYTWHVGDVHILRTRMFNVSGTTGLVHDRNTFVSTGTQQQ